MRKLHLVAANPVRRPTLQLRFPDESWRGWWLERPTTSRSSPSGSSCSTRRRWRPDPEQLERQFRPLFYSAKPKRPTSSYDAIFHGAKMNEPAEILDAETIKRKF